MINTKLNYFLKFKDNLRFSEIFKVKNFEISFRFVSLFLLRRIRKFEKLFLLPYNIFGLTKHFDIQDKFQAFHSF